MSELRDADAVAPAALVPAQTSIAQDRAVHVEPNVWVRHRL